jgi:type IV pilus assembly protein PilW
MRLDRRQIRRKSTRSQGFTLVELLVAMVVGMVAVGAIYAIYTTQLRSYRHHQLLLEMQQNLRAAMVILEQQIRMAGFDPEQSGHFGIADVRRYDLVGTGADTEGQPAIFYTLDVDENGELDPRNAYRNRENCNFRVRHDDSSGHRFLAWDNGMGRHPVAENIQALGLAYAVDVNGDGRLDRWNGGPHLIWAVDTTNDNMLDTHLDTNDDGVIDANDFLDGSGRITAANGGTTINPPIPVDRIKAVRVWLLAVSARPVPGYVDSNTYVVGDRLISGNHDGHMRRVLETMIECRNL